MTIARLCRNQWDRTAAVAFVVCGFVAIVIAWAQVRRTIFAFEQIPLLISGGIVGLALVAVGVGSWLSADLRDEWRKLNDLEDALRTGAGPAVLTAVDLIGTPAGGDRRPAVAREA